ncbi:MAG: hypothetical protein DI556_09825 [Rhodovulum sulfidophilum]|uniref:Phage tail protein n=1 Tax=Rhodovulum sulfidophilum TaxID=35806 RepID=A0A2W5QEC1_RHOSU|nr:MAG: hypothetical protein DI556_09825 [Rhodovulum sulfidophilum]
MLLYDRVVQVAVGEAGATGTAVSGLRCGFQVKKTEDSKENEVRLTVYNASDTTRAALERVANRVTISAGYAASGPQLLAVGDILSGVTDFGMPDLVTSVEAADAGTALRTARASVSYRAGTPARKMVDDLVARLEVDRPEYQIDLEGSFTSGWAFAGKVRDGLDQLAARFGFSWSIQNNALQITKAREPSPRQAVFLSADTGMIGVPSLLDDVRTSDEQSADAKKAGKAPKNETALQERLRLRRMEKPGLRVRSLLNPALVPGDPVLIRSLYRGDKACRILNVVHRGDTHSQEWYSEIECVEY